MFVSFVQKFDVKTVRNWCLDEMEIMSKKRLRAIILRQFLASSSSESEDEEEEEEVSHVAFLFGRGGKVIIITYCAPTPPHSHFLGWVRGFLA